MAWWLWVLAIFGGLVAAVGLLHLVLFLAWWMMLPIRFISGFMDFFIRGGSFGPSEPKHQCPFLRLIGRR